jgi:hypothetical protein
MTTPTIHLNGTSGKELLEGYMQALTAVREAQEKLQQTSPNGRDYYPQGSDALGNAINEHNARRDKLQSVYDELMDLALHCDIIISEDQARKTRAARESYKP